MSTQENTTVQFEEFSPTSSVVPEGAMHWAVQMAREDGNGMSSTYNCYIVGGRVIDAGDVSTPRWAIGQPWLNVKAWFIAKGGHGRRLA